MPKIKGKLWVIQDLKAPMEEGDLQRVWWCFLHIYWWVKRGHATVLDYGQYRTLTFIPFGGPDLWNRMITLLIKEIEVANERNFGTDLATEARLEREWELSGQSRSAILGGERTQPKAHADGPPDWGAKLGDREDTATL